MSKNLLTNQKIKMSTINKNWFGPKDKKIQTINTDLITQKAKDDQKKCDSMSNDEKLKVVKQKLKEYTGNTGNFKFIYQIDDEELEECAIPLCSKKHLQEQYLNKNFKSALDYFNSKNIKVEEDEKKEETEEIKELVRMDSQNHYKIKNKIKIKLIITEITTSKSKKSLRKLISPFTTSLGLSPQFGMFHSALVIGPCKK